MTIHWASLAATVAISLLLFAWILLPSKRPGYATVVAICLAVGAFMAALEVVGQPKPSGLEWRPTAGLEIAGLMVSIDRRSIYVWAVRDGVPISYAVPWPRDTDQLADVLDHWRRRGKTGETFVTGGDSVAKVVAPPPPEQKGTN